mgnify:CR=1 FL=1
MYYLALHGEALASPARFGPFFRSAHETPPMAGRPDVYSAMPPNQREGDFA